MSILASSRHIRFFLRLNFISLLLLLGACNNLLPTGSNLSDTKQAFNGDCPEGWIEWDSKKLLPGRKIGEGVKGAVYELTEGPYTSSEWVVKVYKGENLFEVERYANEDVRVSKNFPELFPEAHFLESVAAIPSGSQTKAGAFVLKERVAGVTLWKLFEERVDTYPYMIPTVLESLRAFREELKGVLIDRLEKKQAFLWDFHANNIMYTATGNKWKIVDADMSIGIENFRKEILRLANFGRNRNHPIQKIKQLVMDYESSDNEQFVEQLIEIYLGDIEKMIEGKLVKNEDLLKVEEM